MIIIYHRPPIKPYRLILLCSYGDFQGFPTTENTHAIHHKASIIYIIRRIKSGIGHSTWFVLRLRTLYPFDKIAQFALVSQTNTEMNTNVFRCFNNGSDLHKRLFIYSSIFEQTELVTLNDTSYVRALHIAIVSFQCVLYSLGRTCLPQVSRCTIKTITIGDNWSRATFRGILLDT